MTSRSVRILRFIINSLLILAIMVASHSCNQAAEKNEANEKNLSARDSSYTKSSLDSELDSIDICTEYLPPNYQVTQSLDTSYNFLSLQRIDTFIHEKEILTKQMRPQNIDLWLPYQWPSSHRNLTVSFLDGDPVVQAKVVSVATEWENYCGIKFLFGSYSDPDISISFRYRGSWSYIGTFCDSVRPSMNLGWLTSNAPDSEYQRVVLHEFGHALGFIHEHQRPDFPIPWDSAKVYAYYMNAPNKWKKDEVDQNIFQKYNSAELNGSNLPDPFSIMEYEIPASLTIGRFHIQSNYHLSSDDKNIVANMYPK